LLKIQKQIDIQIQYNNNKINKQFLLINLKIKSLVKEYCLKFELLVALFKFHKGLLLPFVSNFLSGLVLSSFAYSSLNLLENSLITMFCSVVDAIKILLWLIIKSSKPSRETLVQLMFLISSSTLSIFAFCLLLTDYLVIYFMRMKFFNMIF